MPQRQKQNFSPTLPQPWIVSSTHLSYECRIDNVVAMFKSRHQIRNFFKMSIPRMHIHKVVSTLPQRWIPNSSHSMSWMLKWQHRYNVESHTHHWRHGS